MNRNLDAVWDGLNRFRQRITTEMQEGLAAMPELALPLPQSMLLQTLSQTGPISVGALQAVVRRSQSATSHLVNQLEKRGLAVRKADAKDGRRTTVELSPKGQALMTKVEALRREGFRRAMGRLPPKVAQRLVAALKDAIDALEEA